MKKILFVIFASQCFIGYSEPTPKNKKVNNPQPVPTVPVNLPARVVPDSIIGLSLDQATYIHITGTNLIAADIGSVDAISIDTIPNVASTLRLQAKKPFNKTNMMIVLKDTMINYIIKYQTDLTKSIYYFNFSAPLTPTAKPQPQYSINPAAPIKLSGDKTTATAVAVPVQHPDPQGVVAYKNKLNISKNQNDIKYKIVNLLVDSLNLYIKVEIINNSKFDYKIKNVQFQTVAKKAKLKANAISRIIPVTSSSYFTKNITSIPPHKSGVLVYPFQKFAPNKDEYILATFLENQVNSLGRNVEIKIPPKAFKKAVEIR
jgi:hypothetical protein